MTEKTHINICLATDKNYLQHAGVVVASIFRNANPDDALNFYILQDGLDDDDRTIIQNCAPHCKFTFISPDFSDLPEGKFLKYISRATLLRLQLPSLLSEIDRVIYLDCDVVAVSSLKELWTTAMGSAIAAGVGDYNSKTLKHLLDIGMGEHDVYVNAGVLLLNLKLARQENIEAAFLETASDLEEKATLLDQDIINKTLVGRMHILPLKWNLSTGYFKGSYSKRYYTDGETVEAIRHTGIIHFSGKKKPWLWRRCRHSMWFEYFRIIKFTPWRKFYWYGVSKKFLCPARRAHGPAANTLATQKREVVNVNP